ncbi:hypothetical protein RUM43_008272 [Polyplax serrata]|uniref:Uncharacterized protein n=1 Tax=Polyplax serrata TaxID=468196 RepID=A0AAN8PAD7_POLSC
MSLILLISAVTILLSQQCASDLSKEKSILTVDVLFLDFMVNDTRAFINTFYYGNDGNLNGVGKSVYLRSTFSLPAYINRPVCTRQKQILFETLEGLVLLTAHTIPKERLNSTRILPYGDSVCAELPQDKMEEFLDDMENFFNQKGFELEHGDPFIVNTVQNKLAMGWMALNYALNGGELIANKTVAAALLSQTAHALVFVPQNTTTPTQGEPFFDMGLPFHFYFYRQVLRERNKIQELYASALGSFGERDIRKLILKSTNISNLLETSCFRPFKKYTWIYNETYNYTLMGSNKGESHRVNYNDCKREVREVVSKFQKPTRSLEGRDFYALYAYFELAVRANLIEKEVKRTCHSSAESTDSTEPGKIVTAKNITLEAIEKRAKCVCSSRCGAPFLCMDLVFMYTLFNESYGLKSNTTIHFSNEVKGFPLSWRMAKAFSLYKNYEII